MVKRLTGRPRTSPIPWLINVSAVLALSFSVTLPASEIGPNVAGPVAPAAASKLTSAARHKLLAEGPQEFLVLFDHKTIQDEADRQRRNARLTFEDQGLMDLKAIRYATLKQRVRSTLGDNGYGVRKDYSHLPMAHVRVRDRAALHTLLNLSEVARLYENQRHVASLAESLPLIRQPSVGADGAGTTVAILDTGLDYTRPEFGACTAPGLPQGCRVVHAQDFAPGDGALDADGHGTFVAGITVAVAPGTQIAALDVFDGFNAYASDILEAINWSIANKHRLNIVAINLSLATPGLGWTRKCNDSWAAAAFASARNAGIVPVVTSGNDGFANAINSPACTPGAASVGAVYDANLGPRSWSTCAGTVQEGDVVRCIGLGQCTDSPSARDSVPCFSNSASFLKLLAPGTSIIAAGYVGSGTSAAAPHVSGAVAVLRSAFPGDSVGETLQRMRATGRPIADPKSGVTTPRLDLAAAAYEKAQPSLLWGRTPTAITQDWYPVRFTAGLGDVPVVLATLATFDGGNPAGIRTRNVSWNGFEVRVEEERSYDPETEHIAEAVGYLALASGAVRNVSGGIVGEARSLSVTQADDAQWHRVTLRNAYANPVVLMNMTSSNGGQPCHIRLRHITGSSFQYQIEEWDYLDQRHATESAALIVVEAGVHRLPDGRKLEAGTTQTDHSWKGLSFSTSFSSTPVTLSQVQTYFGRQAAVTRQRNSPAGDLQVRVQEEEGNDGTHRVETIGYVAVGR